MPFCSAVATLQPVRRPPRTSPSVPSSKQAATSTSQVPSLPTLKWKTNLCAASPNPTCCFAAEYDSTGFKGGKPGYGKVEFKDSTAFKIGAEYKINSSTTAKYKVTYSPGAVDDLNPRP